MSIATDHFFAELRKYLRCAVCQERVLKVERVFDYIACTETAVVHCHGDTEVLTVPSSLVEELASKGRMSLGLAFDRKALGNAAEARP